MFLWGRGGVLSESHSSKVQPGAWRSDLVSWKHILLQPGSFRVGGGVGAQEVPQ